MAMRNPDGPRELRAELVRRGARAKSPQRGFTSFRRRRAGRQSAGCAPRASPTTTARRGSSSSARPPVEQTHIAAALTFELSKVKTPVIRERMVSHLLNIDETLAKQVADALGPEEDAEAGRRGDADPAGSRAVARRSASSTTGRQRFEGRKLGILVTDGTDAAILKALKAALDKAGATFEIIAPKVGGAKASDGSWIEADQMIDGGAVGAVRRGRAAAGAGRDGRPCCRKSTARDFVADAFAHCKFIGYVEAAVPLFEKAGIAEADFDDGLVAIARPSMSAGFVAKLGDLRIWDREPKVKMK